MVSFLAYLKFHFLHKSNLLTILCIETLSYSFVCISLKLPYRVRK